MKWDTNIFKYQASKEYEFLIITRIARDHLAIPTTLATSQCVFSVGGDIITKKRNRLGGSNTRKLLYLQDQGILAEGEDEGNSDIEINPDEEDCWEQLHLIIYIIIVRLLILVRIFANSTRVLGRIRRVLEYSTRGPPEQYSSTNWPTLLKFSGSPALMSLQFITTIRHDFSLQQHVLGPRAIRVRHRFFVFYFSWAE